MVRPIFFFKSYFIFLKESYFFNIKLYTFAEEKCAENPSIINECCIHLYFLNKNCFKSQLYTDLILENFDLTSVYNASRIDEGCVEFDNPNHENTTLP